MSHYPTHRSGIFLLCLALISSHEILPTNHRYTPDATTLKIEARESEASITLGKNLVLGSPSSTKASIAVNSSIYDDVLSTRAEPLASYSTIVNRASTVEHGGDVHQTTVSKDANVRGSHTIDSRWAGKRPKTVWKKDSYLEALRHSRNSDDPREGVVWADSKTTPNRREYVQGPVYTGPETPYGTSSDAPKSPRITYGGPGGVSTLSDSYSRPFKPSIDYNDHYDVPQKSYGPPQNSYGPPQNPYGSPQNGPSFYPQASSYGPPGNSYPPPQQGYGPSIHTSVPTAIYGAPYSLSDVSQISILPSIDLGLPLALKLNAFTIAKILLKLVIFKMIVKFIAVICLLLFIPKLEIIKKKVTNKGDDDEERRSLSSPYASSETLNSLEDIVRNSIENYEMQNSTRSNSTEKCTTSACRITEALTFHESWNDYLNLFKTYVEEERRLAERKEQ